MVEAIFSHECVFAVIGILIEEVGCDENESSGEVANDAKDDRDEDLIFS